MTIADRKLFKFEQQILLNRFNIRLSAIAFVLYIILIFIDSHLFTLGWNRILLVRVINALICANVFVYSFFWVNKINIIEPISILLVGSTLIGLTIIMQVTKDYTVNAASWSMLVILFVGLYPLQLKFTLSLVFIALINLSVNFFSNSSNEIIKYEFLTIYYNTLIALVIALFFSIVVNQNRKKEFNLRVSLQKANEDLKTLDRAKNNFFANISHELRTPLTLIHAPVESIINSGKPPDNFSFFESLYKNSSRLLNLISTLLDFSRIESGKLKLVKNVYNISTLLQFICSSFSSAMENKKVDYSISIEEDLLAELDAAYIEKAFINLLSNALKFTPAGGSISVDVHSTNTSVVCNVSDTGVGIPDEKINTIFDRFTQVDNSASRRYEGSGIGLSFAKEIAELHNGSLTVKSIVGKGSTFTLSIPVGNTEESDLYSWHSPDISMLIEEGKLKGKRIEGIDNKSRSEIRKNTNFDDADLPVVLLVEDNYEMRELIESFLSDSFQLISVENGSIALEQLEKMVIPPDIILSDVMMPQMDGYEFTQRVRANANYEGIPIVLITAKSEKSDSISGFQSGAIDYIIKPFNVRELIARINAHLEMKKLRDRLKNQNIQLVEKLKEQIGSQKRTITSTEKIQTVIAFINENYTDCELDRSKLSEAAGISESYLSRSFKELTGKTIPNYISELRIAKAKELLKMSKYRITDVVYYSGFDSIRHFNRIMKKELGISPTEYRKKYITN
jgi:signal transduction histidine kinase/DNA-binding response OmpR family regulator